MPAVPIARSDLPLSVDGLRAAVDAGRTFAYRPFYGHTPRADGAVSDAVFSQFYARPFAIDGVRYAWAEQWMMASKARLFGDDTALAAIMAATTPAACKALGRTVAGYDDARWDAIRFDAVTVGTLAKFGQHDDLRAYLVATGDAILVEIAPRDPIWGIGLGRDNPAVSDPHRWRGRNLLGFALMRARAILRGERPAPGDAD